MVPRHRADHLTEKLENKRTTNSPEQQPTVGLRAPPLLSHFFGMNLHCTRGVLIMGAVRYVSRNRSDR